MNKVYIDTVGVTFHVDVGMDITGATGTELHVMKPDGTEVVWAASIVDQNYLNYTVVADDLDQAGIYRIHSAFALSGWVGKGETTEITIYDHYN